MREGYPVGWFEQISKNKNSVCHPVEWVNVDKEFIYFFDKFCEVVNGSSILLVGTGGTERMFTEWPRVLKGCGATNITYIEIFDGYCNKFTNREYKIIKGDVRKIDEVVSKDEFDLILWFHGPEHIKREEMPQTFEKIRQMCSKGFVSICPFGSYYAEDVIIDNIYEKHIQPDMSVSDFDEVKNVSFFSVGEKDASDAVLFGYYIKGDEMWNK